MEENARTPEKQYLVLNHEIVAGKMVPSKPVPAQAVRGGRGNVRLTTTVVPPAAQRPTTTCVGRELRFTNEEADAGLQGDPARLTFAKHVST